MKDVLKTIQDVVLEDPRCVSDSGAILKNKALELLENNDESLLGRIYNHPDLRGEFFSKIKDFTVFDRERFSRVLNSKEWLSNSFTEFRNKLGLASQKKFLSEANEVVLDWAFKDCYLEGGMDGSESSRNEVFYNETLAPEEVSILLEPKAIHAGQRFSKDGQTELKNFEKDGQGLVTDNLLIKGNNLLGLATLLPKYAGKVKLIYIDPPYNTQGADDTFRYNDAFNHSTWLTFMKNRLEIAKKLLSPDGAIYVQLDYNEVHYCKVLMDEIFGRSNFQREIIWRIGWVSGYKTVEKNWIRNHDSILFYAKDSTQLDFIKQYIKYPEGYLRRDGSKPEGQGYAIEDTWNAYGIDTLADYADDSMDSIAIISFSKEKVGNFKGQKNEALIKRIIEAHTREGDLVLDFFSGTGTTAAVAHKLKRRWIALEQMDNQVEIAKSRLQKVIEGDQFGISKDVGWAGGGEFVSLELAVRNPELLASISKAKSLNDLVDSWHQIMNSIYLSSLIDAKSAGNSIEDFKKLGLNEAKALLFEALDKNSLYVTVSELEDSSLSLSSEDKRLSRDLQGITR